MSGIMVKKSWLLEPGKMFAFRLVLGGDAMNSRVGSMAAKNLANCVTIVAR